VPDNEEDLSKFQKALMELEVAIRLHKEAYEKADIWYGNNFLISNG